VRSIRFAHCAVVAVALLGALLAAGTPGALGATGAGGEASASASCSTVRVNPGKRYGGKQRLRVKAVGRVSCGKARHLTRAYYHKMGAGKCGRLNNFCDLSLAGGWSCSLFFATETQETGGAIAGCARRSARVRMYPVGKRAA
jgi:hypothetical protein